MFEISQVPLDQVNLREGFSNPEAGAFSSFEGWVRNHNDGKKVRFLEYEAADELCGVEFEKISEEVKSKFNIIELKCVHRAGKLLIGDLAVWIGVSAPHREDAFKACRYLIDEVKARLPIWKKEFYADGGSSWVNCHHRKSSKVISSNEVVQ